MMAAALWLTAYLCLSLLLKFQPPVSRIFCLLALGFLVLLLSYWRLMVAHHLVPRHLAHCVRRRILLVGWNEEFRRLVEFTAKTKHSEVELCGILLPSSGQSVSASLPKGLEVIGSYEEVTEAIERCACDGILAGALDLDKADLAFIAAICERELIDFEIVPDGFPALRSGLSLRHIGGVPVLGLGRLPLQSIFNLHLKRCVDVVGGLVGLLLSAPLIVLFGLLVLRESPGPVFYRQRRIGVNGAVFDMLKLRSMRLDAETGARPGWTVKDDPRRLRVGKLMRAWNIDELPQFLNVLKGEMSLVGPRPERPEFIRDFKHIIPHYNLRHRVKPGITGWAQVHGLRGDTDLVERVRHDLYYIEHWSLWLDLQILLMTLTKPASGY
jgi:exopolysaccharide biosynthesis polyprenyl glycosylphosphotransferase